MCEVWSGEVRGQAGVASTAGDMLRQETGEETRPHFGLIYRFTHLQNPQEFPGSVCLLPCFLSTAAEWMASLTARVQRLSPALARFHSTPCSGFRDTALHWQAFTARHAVGSETQTCTGKLSQHTMQWVQRHSPALASFHSTPCSGFRDTALHWHASNNTSKVSLQLLEVNY